MDQIVEPFGRCLQFLGKVAEELYDVFVALFSEGNDDEKVPAQYQRIVSQTLDLKHDIEFGYLIPRSEMTYTQLLGSRAYQRAVNHLKAEHERLNRQGEGSDGTEQVR